MAKTKNVVLMLMVDSKTGNIWRIILYSEKTTKCKLLKLVAFVRMVCAILSVVFAIGKFDL